MVCAVIREVSQAKMCVKIGFSKQVCICSSEVRAFEFRDAFESDTEIQSRKSHEIFAEAPEFPQGAITTLLKCTSSN